jgi:hypothetical protein
MSADQYAPPTPQELQALGLGAGGSTPAATPSAASSSSPGPSTVQAPPAGPQGYDPPTAAEVQAIKPPPKVANEQAPGIDDFERLKLMNFGGSPQDIQSYLKVAHPELETMVEAAPSPDAPGPGGRLPDSAFVGGNTPRPGRVLVRDRATGEDGTWRPIAPSGLGSINSPGEALRTVGDHLTDVAKTGLQAAGEGAGAFFGAAPGAAAGGATGAGIGNLAEQGIGKLLGVRGDIDKTSAATSTVLGGLAPYLFGAGRSPGTPGTPAVPSGIMDSAGNAVGVGTPAVAATPSQVMPGLLSNAGRSVSGAAESALSNPKVQYSIGAAAKLGTTLKMIFGGHNPFEAAGYGAAAGASAVAGAKGLAKVAAKGGPMANALDLMLSGTGGGAAATQMASPWLAKQLAPKQSSAGP